MPKSGESPEVIRATLRRKVDCQAKLTVIKSMTTTILRNKFQRLIQKKDKQTESADLLIFGRKVGLIAKLFGCRHGDISRPFTNGETAYRSCLNCGARKQFNPETLETHGNFYFPPITRS